MQHQISKTTGEVAREILTILESNAKATHKDFEQHWRLHLKGFFDLLPIEQVEGKWELYCAEQRNIHPWRQLVHDKKAMVRILNHAWKNRYLISIPRPLRILLSDRMKSAERDLTMAELRKLLKGAEKVTYSQNWPLLIEVLAVTGLRFSDVRTLEWSDIDLSTGIILVRGVNEKRRTSKTNTLDKVLIEKFKERFRWSGSRYVFPNTRTPDLPMTSNQETFRRIRKDLGINVNLHRLRHFNLSVLTQHGVPADVLSQTRGVSQKTMRSVYLHGLSAKEANETFRSELNK